MSICEIVTQASWRNQSLSDWIYALLHKKKKTPHLTPSSARELLTRLVRGSRGEGLLLLTNCTVILDQLKMTYGYTPRSVHLLVLIWETSQYISETPLNSEIHKQPKCPEWRLQSTQPQTERVYCNLFLLRLQGYLLKRAWKECTSQKCALATRKQCILDTPGQMHKCNPRGWKNTHETRASPSQPNASIDMTVWHETSCLALELLSTPAAARGRDHFLLSCRPW